MTLLCPEAKISQSDVIFIGLGESINKQKRAQTATLRSLPVGRLWALMERLSPF
jgi:hypothetical protein